MCFEGLDLGDMDSLSTSTWDCWYLCRTNMLIFKSLALPVLVYGWKTWTLNSDMRQIDIFVIYVHAKSCGITGMTWVSQLPAYFEHANWGYNGMRHYQEVHWVTSASIEFVKCASWWILNNVISKGWTPIMALLWWERQHPHGIFSLTDWWATRYLELSYMLKFTYSNLTAKKSAWCRNHYK